MQEHGFNIEIIIDDVKANFLEENKKKSLNPKMFLVRKLQAAINFPHKHLSISIMDQWEDI